MELIEFYRILTKTEFVGFWQKTEFCRIFLRKWNWGNLNEFSLQRILVLPSSTATKIDSSKTFSSHIKRNRKRDMKHFLFTLESGSLDSDSNLNFHRSPLQRCAAQAWSKSLTKNFLEPFLYQNLLPQLNKKNTFFLRFGEVKLF